jgi:hypothetical protein
MEKARARYGVRGVRFFLRKTACLKGALWNKISVRAYRYMALGY